MREQSKRAGFTLIELLVVIAIIGALGTLAVQRIVPALRDKDKAVSLDRLKSIDALLMSYSTQYGAYPRASGPDFVLALWHGGIVDHTLKDAEVFFCPSMTGAPNKDLSNITSDTPPDGIDWTGPDLEQYKGGRVRRTDRNANAKPIVCNRVPVVQDEDDLDALPHAGKGIAVLYLGGATEFVPSAEFGEYPIIGPDSPLEKFQKLVPDEY